MLTAGRSWGLAVAAVPVASGCLGHWGDGLDIPPPSATGSSSRFRARIQDCSSSVPIIVHYTTYSFAEAVSSADAADGSVSDENESGYLNSVRSMH